MYVSCIIRDVQRDCEVNAVGVKNDEYGNVFVTTFVTCTFSVLTRRINGCLEALKKPVTISEIRDCAASRKVVTSQTPEVIRGLRLHFQITAAHFPSNFRELVS